MTYSYFNEGNDEKLFCCEFKFDIICIYFSHKNWLFGKQQISV